MVANGIDPGMFQGRRHAVHIFASQAVDDASLIAVPFNHVNDLLRRIQTRQHTKGQIRSIEVTNDPFGVAER